MILILLVSCVLGLGIHVTCYLRFVLFFRVGGKDKPTRFLSFVEAVHGFRHLLTQGDLDKAMSLCTSLKGHLKSKFLVLSDDRVLPPYQPNRGKRSHPDSEQDPGPVKRTNQDLNPANPPTGASGAQAHSSVYVPPVYQPSFASSVAPMLPQGPTIVQSIPQPNPAHTNLLAGVSGVQAHSSISTAQQIFASSVFPPLTQGPTIMQPLTLMSVPPPVISQSVPAVGGIGVTNATAQSPVYKVVQSRRKGKAAPSNKTATVTNGATGRTTPSRAAKATKEKAAQPAIPTVTSPDEPYESCDSNDADGDNLMEEVQA